MLGRHQTTLLNLHARREKPQASVSIREILVTDKEWVDGNYNNFILANETDAAYLKRTLMHITRLTHEATDIHLADNFDVTDDKEDIDCFRRGDRHYRFKPQQRNQVTRLSFNEYYFFPHYLRGPLSEATFAMLCECLEMLASKLPENLHLLLSSFALRSACNHVINIAIYLQGGHSPELRTMAKAHTALIDPTYAGLPSWDIDAKSHASAYLTETGLPVNTCIPFVCKTPDAAFWTAVDICFDHIDGFALRALQQQMIPPNRYLTSLPLQATHILTSNTLLLDPLQLITHTVTHVDPKYRAHYVIKESQRSCPFKFIPGDINDRATLKTCEIRIYPAHAVDVLQDDLAKAVKKHNAKLSLVEMKEEPAKPGFRL